MCNGQNAIAGMPSNEAKRQCLKQASDLFRYGLEMTKVIISDGQRAMVGIGGGAIHVFDMQWNYIKRYVHLNRLPYTYTHVRIPIMAPYEVCVCPCIQPIS